MLSVIAARHVHSPRHLGPLDGATHFGQAGTPGDGPYIQLWFIVDVGIIREAAHRANGCFSSIAAASVAAEVLQGRTVGQALKLEAKDIDVLLGGLPEGKGYCAEMVIEAISRAFGEEDLK